MSRFVFVVGVLLVVCSCQSKSLLMTTLRQRPALNGVGWIVGMWKYELW